MMRLKQIKLAGFKSFAETTKTQFHPNISAVVGPNGCGKSNVIDAIRWVMGENSARQLRAESAVDVIFKGTQTRRPSGRASVSLLFDQDATTGHRYGGYRELEIERIVHRDGVSQYRLNGKTCRRRDIHELFQGTGLGSNHYAVIEQGMIGRMIEAKPHELRAYIEEAAGVSLYKERRQAAEQEMKQTLQNLTRISDLRHDLDQQAEALKTQAEQAEHYRALREAQTMTEQTLAFQQLLEQETLLQEAQAEQAKVLQAWQAQEQNWQHLNQETEAHKQHIQADTKAEQAWVDALLKQHQSWLQCEKEREQARHKLQMQQQAVQTETNKCHQLQQAIATTERESNQQQEQRQILQQQLTEKNAQKQRQQDEVDGLDAQLQAVQCQWQVHTQVCDDLQQELLKHQHQSSAVSAQLQFCDQQAQALEKQAMQRQQSPIECPQALRLKLDPLLAYQTDRCQALQGLMAQLEQVESQRSEITARLLSGQAKQAEWVGRLQASKLWLEQNLPQGQQSVAQVIHCESAWQGAIQRLLGAYLVQPVGEQGFAVLAQPVNWGVLTAEVNLAPWLDQVTFVTDFSETIKPEAIEIKPDGSMRGAHWRLPAVETAQGVLFHQQQMQVLEQQSNDQSRQIQQDKLQEAELHTQCQQLKQSIQERQQELVQCERESVLLQSQIEQAEQIQAQRHEAEQQWQVDRTANDALRQALLKQAQQGQDKVDHTQQQLHTQQALIEDLKQKSSAIKARNQQALEAFKALYDAHQELQKQCLTQDLEAKYQAQALNKLHNRWVYHQARLDEAQQSVTKDHGAAIEQRLHQLALEKKEATTAREALKQKLQTSQQALQALLPAQKSCDLKRQQLQQQGQKLAVAVTQHQGWLQQLAEQLPSGYDKALYKGLLANQDGVQLQQKLHDLQAQIDALGGVNLAALSQFEALSKRQAVLAREWQDVTQGLQDLERAIEVMDAATKKQFKQTFLQVQANFNRLFAEVFEGGQATLKLTETDVLQAGVLIQAQPPGKKNASLRALSGGEKALTSLALVFALFELNPAPFCLLDEVDAPLDDVNVQRFCRLIESMASQVQFILISHNKVSMALAKALIGVTQQELGVSQVVSVQIDEMLNLEKLS
jgi:chromosome segregation protein